MVGPSDVLAVGAHPDDVDLGCGATLARLAAAGRRVGVVDLTAGELGTRGDAEVRLAEARVAAAALGVAWRACLFLPDGGLRADDEAQLAAVVEVLRVAAPRVLLLHHGGDPHPDHGAAAALCERAAFFAGVRRWHPERGGAARPRVLLAFPGPRQVIAPSLVVDVTGTWAAKREALDAHASQFRPEAGAPTHLASGHFLAAIEGRDRAAGGTISCEMGESLVPVGPVDLVELAWLLGSGGEKALEGV